MPWGMEYSSDPHLLFINFFINAVNFNDLKIHAWVEDWNGIVKLQC